MIAWLPTAAFFAYLSYCYTSKYLSIKRLARHTAEVSRNLPSFLSAHPELHPVLQEPFLDLFNRGGKRVRILLTQTIAEICAGDSTILNSKQSVIDGISILIESLHNASLIVDDIEDNSKVRRDQLTVHLKFGVKKSVVSANFVYFKVFGELLKLVDEEKRLGMARIFAEEMVICHLGQADDLFSPMMIRTQQFSADDFLEKDYMRMVISKTGALLRMMVKMVCLTLGAEERVTNTLIGIVEGTGAAFQIYDDYLNLKGNLNKGGVYEDLVERKLTLMVIHTFSQDPTSSFHALFMKPQKSVQQMKEIIGVLERNKSFQYALERMRECSEEVFRRVGQLPNNGKRDVLVMILKKVIYR